MTTETKEELVDEAAAQKIQNETRRFLARKLNEPNNNHLPGDRDGIRLLPALRHGVR